MDNSLLKINWPFANRVHARISTRLGGVSRGVYGAHNQHLGLNLALHVNDDPVDVYVNRSRLQKNLPSKVEWLEQVHGTQCVRLSSSGSAPSILQADAAFTDQANTVCAVLTADCLPVFFANREGNRVAIAHAGWRGLLHGVLKNTVAQFTDARNDLFAHLGPAISALHYEIGAEVRELFIASNAHFAAAFTTTEKNDKWLMDLYAIARQQLTDLGLVHINGGEFCTYRDTEYFYSYRRDGSTGRFASLIWFD